MWRRALLCMPAVLLLLAGQSRAQCRVEGVVRSASKAPVQGATVRLEGNDDRTVLMTTTGADGRYVFEKVTPGIRARILVMQSGRLVGQAYTLVTLAVETVDVEALSDAVIPISADELDPRGGPSGQIGGVVRAADGRAVPAARVTINDTLVQAVTDSAGRYLFASLPAGVAVELRVSAAGFDAAKSERIVPNGGREDADFTLKAVASQAAGTDLSVLQFPPDGAPVPVHPETVAGVPAPGRNDVLRALQFLPGVAGTMEAPGELYVNGGTPGENLITYDGFTVYSQPHVFGTVSALNMDAVEKAGFSEEAVDAADGGRLSGVVHVVGRSRAASRPTGSVDASMLGGGALVSAPLGDVGSVLVAARRSFTGQLYNDTLDRLSGGTVAWARDRAPRFSGGSFQSFPTSSFDDLNAKAEFRPTGKDRVSVTLYEGHDAVNNSRDIAVAVPTSSASFTPPPTDQLPADALVQVNDVQKWTARGLGLVWSRQWSPAASTVFSVGRSTHSKLGDGAAMLADPVTGADYSFFDAHGGSGATTEANNVRDTTVRFATNINVGFGHALSFGADTASLDVDYTMQTEVAVQPGAALEPTSALVTLVNQARSAHVTSVFAGDDWRLFGRLIVSPGLRVTRYDVSGSTYVEPRIGAAQQVTRWLQLRGDWGIDHQEVYCVTREDRLQGDSQFWTLTDGSTIPVPRAQHVAGGARLEMFDLLVDLDAYYRKLDGLSIFAPRLYPGTTVGPNGSFMHEGTGTASGLELAVQHKGPHNSVWASYTLARAEYSYPTLEAGSFPASQDQRHELKIADVAQVGWGIAVSAAWVVGTGRPYTAAVGLEPVWFPSGATVNQVTFGPKNAERLAPYHRLDLSAQRDFRSGWFKSTLGVGVFNVYNRQNVAEREYQVVGNSVMVTDVALMGRMVNVFVRFGF